ncbi:hypothetical protein SFC52_21810 [Niallia circulans]|uniref:hypothetical protein n=1 Tax=Niallia circulans TaxID=1397 RepID=UPI003982BB6B
MTTFKGTVQTQWQYLMSISVMSYCPFYYYFSAFNAILSEVPNISSSRKGYYLEE